MRWVALILVAVNVALGAWIYVERPGQAPSEPSLPAELGSLKLLREARSPGARAARAERASECFTVGPFQTAERAAAAREELSSLGLDPEQRATEDKEVYGYQVLLPPRPSRAAALETTRELSRKGIEDYFVVVSDEELRNAISVGLFREKRYAVRHSEYLDELGFDPELRVRTRDLTRYWQDYRDPRGRVTPELLESLAAEQPLQRLERPCDQ